MLSPSNMPADVAPIRQVAGWVCSPVIMALAVVTTCLLATRIEGTQQVLSMPPHEVWTTPVSGDAADDACGQDAPSDDAPVVRTVSSADDAGSPARK